MSSRMPEIYVHLNGESSKILLQKKGIMKSEDKGIINALKPKQCPNCLELNKLDSRFCSKCKMVLSYDSYNKTLTETLEKETRIDELLIRQDKFEQLIQSLIDSGQFTPSKSCR